MKILYAASNNYGSKIQLFRFLKYINNTSHQIKIAAYKKSSPKNISIDWTLDCLLNIYKPELLSLNNDNLNIYRDQIKAYAPDLIISDLEYFTSYLANVDNIPLWQCSSSLINYALVGNEKYNLGLFKNFAHSLNRDPLNIGKIVNIIDNSNCKFVYSHYGDAINAPQLKENFEWIRPYHQIGKKSIPCQHYIVAGLSNYNKQIINILKKYNDSVIFTEFERENYINVLSKDIDITDEYFCNLQNSSFFICQGQANFLADAFYNNKFSIICPDYSDNNSIINSQISHNLKLGQMESSNLIIDINNYSNLNIELNYNSSIKYLHEKIIELC